MGLQLTVHRGTRQIGGSCIEIAAPGAGRLILDAGRPLDAPEGATGLLPASLDRSKPATVLISHPHQDHHGLLEELPEDWPVWAGNGAAQLIGLTGEITARPLRRRFETWTSRSGPFAIGPFTVTPHLTDHSAFDAYMLQIDGMGQRILYTGDFRRHGRKASLVDGMMAAPPPGIDVLVTEGTNLGTDKPVRTESELEDEFIALFSRTAGRVFVCWSGQNIDRTVTLFRAAKRTGRTLVIDLYTADVLDRIGDGTRLPRPGMSGLQVVVTSSLARNYRRRGRGEFVDAMAKRGVAARNVPRNGVIMLRQGLVRDYTQAGLLPTAEDAFNFSMWRGYLDDAYSAGPLEMCRAAGAEIAFIHTSGHASPADLRAFASAMNARVVVPVHGVSWDEEAAGFGAVRRLADGETFEIP